MGCGGNLILKTVDAINVFSVHPNCFIYELFWRRNLLRERGVLSLTYRPALLCACSRWRCDGRCSRQHTSRIRIHRPGEMLGPRLCLAVSNRLFRLCTSRYRFGGPSHSTRPYGRRELRSRPIRSESKLCSRCTPARGGSWRGGVSQSMFKGESSMAYSPS